MTTIIHQHLYTVVFEGNLKKIVLLLDKGRLYVDFASSVRICLARDSKN